MKLLISDSKSVNAGKFQDFFWNIKVLTLGIAKTDKTKKNIQTHQTFFFLQNFNKLSVLCDDAFVGLTLLFSLYLWVLASSQ